MPDPETPQSVPEALATDLADVAELAARPETVEAFVRQVLDALSEALPVELASFYELVDGRLELRAARGASTTETLRRKAIAFEEVPDLRRILDDAMGASVVLTDDDGPEGIYEKIANLDGGRSCLLVPVRAGGEPLGLLSFETREPGRYDAETRAVGRIYGLLIGVGLAAARHGAELEAYQDSLREQNRLLLEEVEGDSDAAEALESSVSRSMRRIVSMAKQVAITDAPVLITGETGSGKEVLARAIHGWSRRSEAPFIQVNCAALPENLVESELFGHRRGAFSGAVDDRLGRFRLADGGTLLLDEVGDLPVDAQVKLLRVLQENAFEPVGDDKTVRVDVRVVAATNVDLERAIESGRFREDLFYRLNVFPIAVPPLRERTEDIPILAERILDRIRRRTGRGPWSLSTTSLNKLQRYDWPGNVRELVNSLERARIASPAGGRLTVDISPGGSRRRRSSRRSRAAWPTLDAHQRDYIEQVLEETAGKIYGDDGAAALLRMPPTTLQSRMRRLGIESQRKKRRRN